jgi:ankyrin repeat protein
MENELWHVARIGNVDLVKNILNQLISGSTNQLLQSTVTLLNAKDDKGFSALHWAVILGREDMINVQSILIYNLAFVFRNIKLYS